MINPLNLLALFRNSPNEHRCQTLEFVNATAAAQADVSNNNTTHLNPLVYNAFSPLHLDDSPLHTYRLPDTLDTFTHYKYRDHPSCNISSLSLHNSFSPLCPDRSSFLRAFSGGGRIGFDAPFMPRDCDMRWFATEEVCEILGRFEKVIVVGDSMMRHVVGAMNVLLRKDLGYGAVTGWNFGEEESEQCFCTHQMDVKSCSVQGIYRTSDVLINDPHSFACPQSYTTTTKDPPTTGGKKEVTSPVNLIIELMLKFPLDPSEITRFKELLPRQKPERPIAFVFGHGLWNDLDLQATVNWLNGILEAVYEGAPYLRPENLPRGKVMGQSRVLADQKIVGRNTGKNVDGGSKIPMAHILFITPSAAGPLKPDQWIASQGDKALQVFEKSMHSLIHDDDGMFYGKGIEHMGTWNMSIQMEKWDGVHLDLRGNLLKAMGVVNWLSGIETELWSGQV